MRDEFRIKPGQTVHAMGFGDMEGLEGPYVGAVDHLDGESYIKLTKHDSFDGEHHWIPLSWVEEVDEDAIYLNKTEAEFRSEVLSFFPDERVAV